MNDASYMRPSSLDEALALKAGGDMQVLAGGTDVFPARANLQAWGNYRRQPVLDISAIADLRAIEKTGDFWRIGALATWSDIIQAGLPAQFDGLKLAAKEVGGVQIQNRGTLAGNLVNASPAADGVPPLLALDAGIEVQNTGGRRKIPLGQFIDGYRHTALEPDELVTAILVPKADQRAIGHFLKLGARRYLVISIAMAACVIVPDEDGTIVEARIALGSCSPVAVRLEELERDLADAKLEAGLGKKVSDRHFKAIAPIDDIRASADYRLAAAKTLVADMIEQVAGQNPRRLGDAG